MCTDPCRIAPPRKINSSPGKAQYLCLKNWRSISKRRNTMLSWTNESRLSQSWENLRNLWITLKCLNISSSTTSSEWKNRMKLKWDAKKSTGYGRITPISTIDLRTGWGTEARKRSLSLYSCHRPWTGTRHRACLSWQRSNEGKSRRQKKRKIKLICMLGKSKLSIGPKCQKQKLRNLWTYRSKSYFTISLSWRGSNLEITWGKGPGRTLMLLSGHKRKSLSTGQGQSTMSTLTSLPLNSKTPQNACPKSKLPKAAFKQ